MRIVVVGVNQGVVGGAETYLIWLFGALITRGHQVAFAFERASAQPERAVDRGLDPLVRWNLQDMTRSVFLAQVAAFEPDIVFLQGSEDESIDIALSQRFRCVLFAHAFYATCATGWRVHRIPMRQICTRRFGPACLPINYLRGCGARNPVQLLDLYSRQRARSNVVRKLAGTVVASQYMREVYVHYGVAESDVRVIPYPVQVAPDIAPPTAHESRSRILFLGRLTSGKGGTRAVQATARCERALGRRLHLTVAGEGPELARCQRLARKLGLQADFPGWVSPDQRLALLRASDVLVVPSLWPEPFGIVGIEAAAVGLPAVAYRAGGIVDWLRPGVTGELAEGSGFGSRALAGALECVLSDANHHHALQLGAWRMAHEFSAERHISQLEQLFTQLAAPGTRRQA